MDRYSALTENDIRVDYEININEINKKYARKIAGNLCESRHGEASCFFLFGCRSFEVFTDFFEAVTGEDVGTVLEEITELSGDTINNLLSFVLGVSSNAANT